MVKVVGIYVCALFGQFGVFGVLGIEICVFLPFFLLLNISVKTNTADIIRATANTAAPAVNTARFLSENRFLKLTLYTVLSVINKKGHRNAPLLYV